MRPSVTSMTHHSPLPRRNARRRKTACKTFRARSSRPLVSAISCLEESMCARDCCKRASDLVINPNDLSSGPSASGGILPLRAGEVPVGSGVGRPATVQPKWGAGASSGVVHAARLPSFVSTRAHNVTGGDGAAGLRDGLRDLTGQVPPRDDQGRERPATV